jgi:hypothetical protein
MHDLAGSGSSEIAISGSGRFIATPSLQGIVGVVDRANGILVPIIYVGKEPIRRMAFEEYSRSLYLLFAGR